MKNLIRTLTASAILTAAAPWAMAADGTGEAESTPILPCCSYSGHVTDRSTGRGIAGVRVSFRKEGAHLYSRPVGATAITDASGAYSVPLSEGSYSFVAHHPGYVMHASLPSLVSVRAPYFRELEISPELGSISVEVTAEAHKTANIRLSKRSSGVLLVTTSRLERTPAFETAIASYRAALLRKGMTATFVVLDSDECFETYGTSYSGGLPDGGRASTTQWTGIRKVLKEVARQASASYIILLGGTEVVPRPWPMDALYHSVPSDGAYVDFDGDFAVDAGFAVGRFPDLGTESSGVVAALETAVTMHGRGGYSLSTQARFSNECWLAPPVGLGDACSSDDIVCGVCYRTPPYGTCADCGEREEFERLVSTSAFLSFLGHGSSTRFSDNDRNEYFTVDALDTIDLEGHPVVFSLGACNAGNLSDTTATWSTELIRKGASVYLARTSTLGTSAHLATRLPEYIWGTDVARPYRAGDALFELMRETVLYNGSEDALNTIQMNLNGDPTLSLRPATSGMVLLPYSSLAR